ncbi:unnamed protein product [Peniophora sp. CBMAI 1063]|nr:unnamed protein product [Peniophora sp. CBMAI 1063]
MSIVHPSVEEGRWLSLLASQPERVVELLRLRDDTPMTDDGDTGADHEPAFRALLSLTSNLTRPQQRTVWDGLVDVGLAQALCAIIADRTILANETKLGGDESTTWTSSANVLVRWAVSVNDYPSRTDVEVVVCLKKNWSAMMRRLYGGQFVSKFADQLHTPRAFPTAPRAFLTTLPAFLTAHTATSQLYSPPGRPASPGLPVLPSSPPSRPVGGAVKRLIVALERDPYSGKSGRETEEVGRGRGGLGAAGSANAPTCFAACVAERVALAPLYSSPVLLLVLYLATYLGTFFLALCPYSVMKGPSDIRVAPNKGLKPRFPRKNEFI